VCGWSEHEWLGAPGVSWHGHGATAAVWFDTVHRTAADTRVGPVPKRDFGFVGPRRRGTAESGRGGGKATVPTAWP